MEALDKRAREVLEKRERLSAELERTKGRYQASLEQIQQIHAECASLGVDPDHLEEEIQALLSKYQALLDSLSKEIQAVDAKLEPFRDV
jgi:predicted nuclease with TOPRIM domain